MLDSLENSEGEPTSGSLFIGTCRLQTAADVYLLTSPQREISVPSSAKRWQDALEASFIKPLYYYSLNIGDLHVEKVVANYCFRDHWPASHHHLHNDRDHRVHVTYGIHPNEDIQEELRLTGVLGEDSTDKQVPDGRHVRAESDDVFDSAKAPVGTGPAASDALNTTGAPPGVLTENTTVAPPGAITENSTVAPPGVLTENTAVAPPGVLTENTAVASPGVLTENATKMFFTYLSCRFTV